MNHIQTIGIDFKIKMIFLDNLLIKLQIWDKTPCCQRIRIPLGYESDNNGAHGFIFNYDITDIESFEYIKDAINKYKTIEKNMKINICKILLGNKCDESKRCVSEEDGRKLAQENNMGFFETSSKNNTNVNEAFEYLTKQIIDKVEKDELYIQGFLLKKYKDDLQKRKKGCFS